MAGFWKNFTGMFLGWFYQNCSNCSNVLNKIATRAKNRKTFRMTSLLIGWMDFEIISQKCSLGHRSTLYYLPFHLYSMDQVRNPGPSWPSCSETVLVYDMKVNRCIQPNKYMNLYVFQRSRPSSDLGPGSLRFLQIVFQISEIKITTRISKLIKYMLHITININSPEGFVTAQRSFSWWRV